MNSVNASLNRRHSLQRMGVLAIGVTSVLAEPVCAAVFMEIEQAQKVHFNDGGQFDKLYTVK